MILENVPSTVNFQAPSHNSDVVEEMAASSDPLYKCDQCTSAFVDLNSLKEHQSQVHGSVLGPPNITTGLPIATHNESPIFECPTCGKSFHCKDNLRQHEKIHLTVKPFPCNQCPKSYVRNADLQIHQKATHLGVRFPCKLCNKSYYYIRALHDHQQKKHLELYKQQ